VRRRLSEDNLQDMNVLDRHAVRLIVTDWKIWIKYVFRRISSRGAAR